MPVVAGRQADLPQMMRSLEKKATRYADLLAELGGPGGSPGPGAPVLRHTGR